jgi:hypothetical protein
MEDQKPRKRNTPASRAIRLLGVKRIATRCDLTSDAVNKWSQAPGGLIPARHQRQVLELARELGKDFTAEDILGVPA